MVQFVSSVRYAGKFSSFGVSSDCEYAWIDLYYSFFYFSFSRVAFWIIFLDLWASLICRMGLCVFAVSFGDFRFCLRLIRTGWFPTYVLSVFKVGLPLTWLFCFKPMLSVGPTNTLELLRSNLGILKWGLILFSVFWPWCWAILLSKSEMTETVLRLWKIFSVKLFC